MSQLKLTLVALHGAIVAQFSAAPHYIEESVVTKEGHIVNITTGDGPNLNVAIRTTDLPDGGTKKKFTVNLQAPAGAGLRNPVTKVVGADRDEVLAAIQEAVSKIEGGTEQDVRIVLVDGKEPATPAAG